jgi:hypothetical protein
VCARGRVGLEVEGGDGRESWVVLLSRMMTCEAGANACIYPPTIPMTPPNPPPPLRAPALRWHKERANAST